MDYERPVNGSVRAFIKVILGLFSIFFFYLISTDQKRSEKRAVNCHRQLSPLDILLSQEKNK